MRKFISVAALGVIGMSLAACDVEQTEEAELPEVETTGGNLPEYDVDAADIDVGMEEQTVEVPTIDVDPADAGEETPPAEEEPPVE